MAATGWALFSYGQIATTLQRTRREQGFGYFVVMFILTSELLFWSFIRSHWRECLWSGCKHFSVNMTLCLQPPTNRGTHLCHRDSQVPSFWYSRPISNLTFPCTQHLWPKTMIPFKNQSNIPSPTFYHVFLVWDIFQGQKTLGRPNLDPTGISVSISRWRFCSIHCMCVAVAISLQLITK